MQGKLTFRERKIKVSLYYCCFLSLRVAVSKGSIRVGTLPIPHILRMTAELASKACFTCTLDCCGSGIVVKKYKYCQLDLFALELNAHYDLQRARYFLNVH
jgi:hypothetical protein